MFGPNVETTARHTLARNGISLPMAHGMTDNELLALTGFGKTCLAWLRSRDSRERCPTCHRLIRGPREPA